MMMNIKKNQNNAVCSMDCKNCPHGASQPNPMDDPMFEKSIAMLHNWVMLEAMRWRLIWWQMGNCFSIMIRAM